MVRAQYTYALAMLLSCSFSTQAVDGSTGSSSGESSTSSGQDPPGTTEGGDGISDSSGGSLEVTDGSSDSEADTGTDGDTDGDTDGSTSGSTGGLEPAYPFCDPDDAEPCADPDSTCIWTDGVADMTTPAGFCSPICDTPADCPPPPPESDAVPACTYYYADLPLYCHLRCESGETCPDGTECRAMMTFPETSGWYTFVCA